MTNHLLQKLQQTVDARASRLAKNARAANRSVFSLFACSLCVLCLSLMVFTSTSLAWFTGQSQTGISPIVTASFALTLELESSDGTDPVQNQKGFSFPASAGEVYTLHLRASGTSQAGYALIRLDKAEYSTQSFQPEETISITLIPEQSGTIVLEAVWGQSSETELLEDGKAYLLNAQSSRMHELSQNVLPSAQIPDVEETIHIEVYEGPSWDFAYETETSEKDWSSALETPVYPETEGEQVPEPEADEEEETAELEIMESFEQSDASVVLPEEITANQ